MPLKHTWASPVPDRCFIYIPPLNSFEIIYRDDDLIISNKPAGLLSVPGKTPDLADCMVARVQQEYPNALPIHRLDMDTSGLMVFAQNPKAQRNLGLQFERRKVTKIYTALVAGCPAQTAGTISYPLFSDWPNRPRQMVDWTYGDDAITDYQTIDTKNGISRIDLFPKTGRTHQLRVHCAAKGWPILGDRFYAPDEVYTASNRLMLHATQLEFHHPANGELVRYNSQPEF